MIKIGGMVNIKDAEINTQIKVEQKTGLTGVPQKTEPIPMVSNDGSYKVIAIEYNGDTRGNEWYQTLTCLDIDATVPSKKVKTEETPWGEGE